MILYLVAVAEKRAAQDYTEVSAIPSLKRGRPLTLGEVNSEVQQYLRALNAAGTPVNSAIVIASAKGIVMTKNRLLLAEYGGSHCFDHFMGKIITYQNGHGVQKGINYTVQVITTGV